MNNQVADIKLFPGAARGVMRMYSAHDGVDQTARAIQSGGWAGFEHPLPTQFFTWAKRRPGVILDVGANTGLYSLLGSAASLNNDVLAFEAHPGVFKVLQGNIGLNYGCRITALQVAITNNPGTVKLYVPKQGHGLVETSSSLEQDFKADHSEIMEVTATTIDEVAKAHVKAGMRVTLAKVDIEGHEFKALAGGGWTIHHHRPILFVEVLNRADFAQLSAYIAQHAYLDVPLVPDGRFAAYAAVEYHPKAWNHAFVPHEMLPEFLRGS